MENVTVIRSGHILEVSTFTRRLRIRPTGGRVHKEGHRPSTKNRSLNQRRSRLKIKRLAASNFSKNSLFVTLTFENIDMCTSEYSHRAYKALERFLQRLRRHHPAKLRYLVVPQFQDQNGREALHFHMLVALPNRFGKQMSSLWGYGYVCVREIKDIDNVGAYLLAHMPKEDDDRLGGHKLFSYSHNLKRPIVYKGSDAEKLIQNLNLDKKNEVYSASYDTEHLGKVTYTEYNLRRNK